MSNLIAAFGGFWVASQWNVDWLLLIYMLVGSTLVMACSTVFNNVMDREMDQKMTRTKTRATAEGRLTPAQGYSYAVSLGVVGLAMLYWLVNPLTAMLGILGIFVYVVIYTAWLKRRSTWSTSIGAISGSMPPVIGYCAVANTVDAGAWILFIILFLWQPPHFWALGIRRTEEYRKAGFPLLPVVKGIKRTKIQMIPYVVLIIPATILFYTFGYVGIIFLVSSIILGLIWLIYCIAGLFTKDTDKWAMKTFMISIYYLMAISIIMVIDTIRL